MTRTHAHPNMAFIRAVLKAAILVLLLMVVVGQAQTFTVLHNFGGSDGTGPHAGVTIDAAGNLYGTTLYGGLLNCDAGGVPGCGVAYKLKKQNSSWILSVLYDFPGNDNNFLPTDPSTPTLGPDGVPYGVQIYGSPSMGGILYQLQPPLTAPVSANEPWIYTVDWVYGRGNDGGYPTQVVFDPEGNIWGAEGDGGPPGAQGDIYELTHSNGSWKETIVYSFLGGSDGEDPDGAALDPAGNIYGVTRSGGGQCGCGTVYELTHTGSAWTKTILYNFVNSTDGSDPGALARDSSGNLFGLTARGASGNGGTIWELSPSGGGWVFTVLYTFPWQTQNFAGPFRPIIGADGSLYGVNNWGGADNYGSVYRLAPANGGWNYTDIHTFTGGADGCYPVGPVALDPAGNIYGTASACAAGGGDVWEIVP